MKHLKVKLTTLSLLAILAISVFTTSCQQEDNVIPNMNETTNPELDERFKNYEIVQIDNQEILNTIENQGDGEVNLDMRSATPSSALSDWSFKMKRLQVQADDFKFHLIGEGGTHKEVQTPETYVMQGFLGDNTGEVLMMINETNLHAEIVENGHTYRLEPLTDFILDAAPNEYIKYNIADIIDNEKRTCSFDESMYDMQEVEESDQALEERAGNCLKVEVTFMGDFELYAYKFGYNSGNAYNWMYWRVINAGKMYYSYNGFPINFIIKGGYVNTWNGYISNSSNASSLLNGWLNFGNNNSWLQKGDANILFTGKSLHNNVAGVAYLRAICTWYAYGVVEHTWNSQSADIITAHEIGHILGANHSNGGFMNSYLNGQTWMHSQTWNDLNNWVWGHSWCLGQWGCQW